MDIILLFVPYMYMYTSFSCVKPRIESKGMQTDGMAVGKAKDEHMGHTQSVVLCTIYIRE